MTKATLTFQDADQAHAFMQAWGRETLTGHTRSPQQEDGSFTVEVYDVNEEKRQFIESYIAAAA